MKNTFTIIMMCILTGCFAGGIGQYHDPTQNVLEDDSYMISLELFAPGGNANRAFTAAQIIIANHNPRDMERASADRKKALFITKIPVSELPVGEFTYYFVYQSDRERYEFRPTNNLPIKVKDR